MDLIKRLLVKTSNFTGSLMLLSGFAIVLSLYRMLVVHSNRYWFLIWNLFLAWLPLLFAWILYRKTPKGLFWSWANFGLFVLWLVFLPNAFYLFTDLVHLNSVSNMGLMYDTVLIGTYAWCGFLLGYVSLYLIHWRSYQRFGRLANWIPIISLLLSGFAIYIGRYLRWNSWDIVVNPFGLLFDVTDRLINPGEHILTFSVTFLFFLFLSIGYFIFWQGVNLLKHSSKK